MSADNGVYILKTNKQYRVKHLSAIDNLYWDYSTMQSIDTPVSTRILEMFGDCKYTYSYETALKIASKILKYLPTCEYGIQLIDAEMKWTTILKNAKLHIDKEINSIKDGSKWEDEVINLLSLKERMKESQFKPKHKINSKLNVKSDRIKSVTIEDAIKEFEDEAYHHSIKSTISDEAKTIALKVMYKMRDY